MQCDPHTEICLECKVNLLQTFLFMKRIKDIQRNGKTASDSVKNESKQEEPEVVELSDNEGHYKEEGETSDSDSDYAPPIMNGINNKRRRLDKPPSHEKLLKVSPLKNENVKNGSFGPGDKILDIMKDYSVTSDQMCKIFCDLLQNHTIDSVNQHKVPDGINVCSTCLKGFTSEYHLTNHIKYHHLKVYHYVCNICKRAYHNQQILDRHACSGFAQGRPSKNGLRITTDGIHDSLDEDLKT